MQRYGNKFLLHAVAVAVATALVSSASPAPFAAAFAPAASRGRPTSLASFAPRSPAVAVAVSSLALLRPSDDLLSRRPSRNSRLASSPSPEDGGGNDDTEKDAAATGRLSGRRESATSLLEDVAMSVAGKEDKPENPYPIDLPSPVLLGSSVVFAIASIGSLFEVLGGGKPPLGFVPTVIIILVGLPACLFLFFAAIKKGAAETEEDDADYNKPRRL